MMGAVRDYSRRTHTVTTNTTKTPNPQRIRAFHAMAKPSGADCNLHCAYCFYLEKQSFYPSPTPRRMSQETLEAYVRSYLDATGEGDEAAFTWQGGEPTLLGLEFYRRAVALQLRHGPGRRITNSFQTNGVLLDDSWCEFFRRHNFLVGLSLDGPADIHDDFRRTAGGRPSHGAVMRALRLLQRHGVEYNTLSCVNRRSSREPLRVYEFLCDAGVRFMQFLPVVERIAGKDDMAEGMGLSRPGAESGTEARVTDWSVLPKDYGRFLTDIFDTWVKRDVGQTFVMNFEWALANFTGNPGTVCHHQPTCGRSVVVEHNGDVYACDHYVYPQYRLGNIHEHSFADMLDSPGQKRFGRDKHAGLPERCKKCRVLKGCWGGCPKHRFIADGKGNHPVNYLCDGLNQYFEHVAPYLRAMAQLIETGRPPADIMAAKVFVKPRLESRG